MLIMQSWDLKEYNSQVCYKTTSSLKKIYCVLRTLFLTESSDLLENDARPNSRESMDLE